MAAPASAPSSRPMASLLPAPLAIAPARYSGTAANTQVSSTATTYLLSTTDRLLTGVASRCTMLPSSISPPRTLPPTSSEVSATTSSPTVPRTSGGQTGLCAVLVSSAEMPIRMAAGSANKRARLRLMVARSVSRMTTPFSSPSIVLTGLSLIVIAVMSGRQQIGEDALERLVGRRYLQEPDAIVAGDSRDLPCERAVVGGPHLQAVGRELHRADCRAAHEGRRECPVVGRGEHEHVRAVRHEAADRPEVARGG